MRYKHAFSFCPCCLCAYVSHGIMMVQDVLPAEKADNLLARLLSASRDWTSRPWYNASGTPGMTHNRSCMYRIPAARDSSNSNNTTTTNNNNSSRSSGKNFSGTGRDQAHPMQGSDNARRRAGSGTTAHYDRVNVGGGGGADGDDGGGECAGPMGRKNEYKADGTAPQSSSEDESFDYGFTDAGNVDDGDGDGGGGSGGGDNPPGSVTVAVGRQEGDAMGSMSTSANPDAKDPAGTKSWIDDDQGAAVAPEELLDIVPLVVETVRRCVRQAPVPLAV